MEADSHRLRKSIKALKQKNDVQEAQNVRLKLALLRALLGQKGKSKKEADILLAMDADMCEDEQDKSETEDYDSDDEDDESQDEDGDADGHHEPIDDAGVPRCVDCTGEVIEGACHLCGTEHTWVPELYEESKDTDSHAVDLDRSFVPRGDTPLCDVVRFKEPPKDYSKEEYTHLLKRGATRLMVKTFFLDFTPQDGIVAWADQDLFNEFAGPSMKEGHQWKIHLGRRVKLDEDDLDGSEFIEGLLEDALLFPADFARWETVQETPGLWTTRLKAEDAAELQEPLEFKSDVEEENNIGAEGEKEGEGEEGDGDDTPRPIMDLDYYQTTHEESSDSEEFEDESLAMALDDSGWAIRANVRDSSWSDADMDEDEGDEDETDSGYSNASMDDSSDTVRSGGDSANSNLVGSF